MSTSTKKITIHDLAKVLKLDSSTVSRALSDSPRVGIKTKTRVKALASKMGYQRNMIASNLRSSKTMTIGVVVPFISRHVFSQVIDGIEQIASKKGYRVIISQSYDSFDIEKKILQGMFLNRVDGLLISPNQSVHTDEHLSIFTNNNIPVVLFDRYYENSKIPKVILEDKQAMFNVTQHMIDLGRTNILHITGNLKSTLYGERFSGYKEALKTNNIPYNKDLVKSIDLYDEKAIEVLKDVLSRGEKMPDGIICANDVTALAVLQYLMKKTDIKVPEDIAITGFSNSPSSFYINGGLTSVNQYSCDMGKNAINMLLDLIEDKKGDLPKTIVIESNLVVRGSTGGL
ncbi:MAG: LacI family DNA-binding transcriptional regulator [Ichthyobacteriaceae bacterium]|nr:LacI family DNA-binding transcriptional regulator [Ichthyobacteriaceae bacterium]